MTDTGTPADTEQEGGGGDAGLMDPEMARNPQPSYKLMRELAPVVEVEGGQLDGADMGGVVVGLHADVLETLRNPGIFSSGFEAVKIGQVRPLIPLQIDPPDHVTYRKLLDPLFAPRKVAELEPGIRELARGLVDAVADQGSCNFHDDIAEPYPSTVFLQLLGLPLSRTQEFLDLKDGIIRPPARTPAEREAMITETGQRIYAVLDEVIDARLQEPQEDFISGFLTAEIEGRKLTRDEVVDICYLFFLAGLDTVTASLDCMLAFLAQHPGHRQEIADDPAVIPHVVEELLRWETPVTGVVRRTTQATELSGCPIPADKQVFVLLGSANTDEAAWEHADEVDFHRDVNKHLAFGGGVHRCLGSHLARQELRVMLEEWHARVPEYQLPDDTLLKYSPGLRQVETLPLVW